MVPNGMIWMRMVSNKAMSSASLASLLHSTMMMETLLPLLPLVPMVRGGLSRNHWAPPCQDYTANRPLKKDIQDGPKPANVTSRADFAPKFLRVVHHLVDFLMPECICLQPLVSESGSTIHQMVSRRRQTKIIHGCVYSDWQRLQVHYSKCWRWRNVMLSPGKPLCLLFLQVTWKTHKRQMMDF